MVVSVHDKVVFASDNLQKYTGDGAICTIFVHVSFSTSTGNELNNNPGISSNFW